MHETGLSPISGMTQKQVNGLGGNSEVILVGGEASGNGHRPTQVVKEERGKVTCPKITTVFGNWGTSCLHLRSCLCRIHHVLKHVYDRALLHEAQLRVFPQVLPL